MFALAGGEVDVECHGWARRWRVDGHRSKQDLGFPIGVELYGFVMCQRRPFLRR